jgi:KDO2-lipid IV(A) lauroyltransferase
LFFLLESGKVNGVTKMASSRSQWLDFLIYVIIRLGLSLLQAFPAELACRMADMLAWIAYWADRRHRRIAIDNLRHAFPRWRSDQHEAVARGCFRHLLHMVVEIACLPRRLAIGNWRRYVTLVGGDRIVSALLAEQPVLIVTGHLGNWELAGYVLGLFGFHTHAIARELDNPHLDRFLRRFREKTGQRILAKKGEFDQITRVLADGGIIATLADQDAGQRGVFVEFFGRPASTHKAIALMAIEYNALLVVAGVPRISERPVHFHVKVEESIDPQDYGGRPDAITAITQRYTAALERLIRQYPEQYFWMHRRWKHQPVARSKRAA